MLTESVIIDQSEGIHGACIPPQTFVKFVYKRFLAPLAPVSPRFFTRRIFSLAFPSSCLSPLSERLEQATPLFATRIKYICNFLSIGKKEVLF